MFFVRRLQGEISVMSTPNSSAAGVNEGGSWFWSCATCNGRIGSGGWLPDELLHCNVMQIRFSQRYVYKDNWIIDLFLAHPIHHTAFAKMRYLNERKIVFSKAHVDSTVYHQHWAHDAASRFIFFNYSLLKNSHPSHGLLRRTSWQSSWAIAPNVWLWAVCCCAKTIILIFIEREFHMRGIKIKEITLW